MEISNNGSSTQKVEGFNRVQEILIFCSGANPEVLKQCPVEVGKYLAVGSTVLLTAVLASISGGYAVNFVFNNLAVSIIVGLFWGVLIFNLDRYIVMSIRKKKAPSISDILRASTPEEKKKLQLEKLFISSNQLMMALPRILVAIVIAITVSKPIELRLFNNRIEKQLSETQRGDMSECEEEFNGKFANSQEEISKIDGQEQSEKDRVFTGNPVYTELGKNIKDQEQKAESLKGQIKRNESTIQKNYVLVDVPYYRDTVLADGTRTRYQAGIRKVSKPNQIALSLMKENKDFNKELTSLLSTITQNKSEKDKIEGSFGGEIAAITQKFDIQRKPHLDEIQRLNGAKPAFMSECSTKSMASVDLLSRLEALEIISKKSETIYYASLLITLLFILLETSPVFVKLLSPRGPYEEILDRIEHEHYINENEKISAINSRINELLERAEQAAKLEGDVFLKSEEMRVNQELESNANILAYIAEKQEKLALLEIDKWYAAELAKHSPNGNGSQIPTIQQLATNHQTTSI